jgi:hypothetical protein
MTAEINLPVNEERILSGIAPRPIRLKRWALVICGLGIWFWTQSLIGQRVAPDGVGDVMHAWTAPVHAFLVEHPHTANGLLIGSSALIDLLGIFLLVTAIFGPTVRPFLGLLMLFALRQVCQGLCALPAPPGMIWHSTGVPSLLVTYGVSNDLFFSGHTGLAVLGAVELARLKRPWLAVIGILVACFEAGTVLVLRAHYSMDVFTGALAALYVAGLAAVWAPGVDWWLKGAKPRSEIASASH